VTGQNALIAAAHAKAYVVGAETGQYLMLPEVAPRMLTSAIKLSFPEVFKLIKRSRDA
jgi:hypothetical protein